jgi:hypothetical protein
MPEEVVLPGMLQVCLRYPSDCVLHVSMPSGKGPAHAHSIRIDPNVRAQAKARAKRFGISFSLYTAFLVRAVVHGHDPKIPANIKPSNLIRDPVCITMTNNLWKAIGLAAADRDLSISEFIETLYLDAAEQPTIVVYPVT